MLGITKKIREEENASGIAVNDLTEKEGLIEELVSREDIVTASEAETENTETPFTYLVHFKGPQLCLGGVGEKSC